MLLTVCIAAGHRQPLLHECVNNVSEVADQLLLVEPAGAHNEVPGIARLHFDEAAGGDLEATLNEALSESAGEWFLLLMGHERLQLNGHDLRESLLADRCDAFALRVRRLHNRPDWGHRLVAADHPLMHGATSATDRWRIRLFRRRKGLYFGGRVEPSIHVSLQGSGARVVRENACCILEHSILMPDAPNRAGARLAKAREVVERYPHNPDAWLDAGRCLLQEARLAGAALECFDEARSLRPDVESCLATAQALVAQERFAEALDALDELAIPPGTIGDETRDADFFELRGELLRALQRPDAAADAYAKALAIAPDKPAARLASVEVLCALQEHEQAKPHTDWLRENYPGCAQTWIAAALVELSARQTLSAIASLRVALDIEPYSVIARYHLASAYAGLGARSLADTTMRQAFQIRGGIPMMKELALTQPVAAPEMQGLQPLGRNGVVSFIPFVAGGAGRVAVDIVRALSPHHPQTLVTYDRSDFVGMGLLDELAELDVPVVSIGSAHQLAPLQKFLDPGVLIHHAGPPQNPTPAASTATVLIAISHGHPPMMLSHFDYYVCLSKAHRRHHAYLPEQRMQIIPNAVDTVRFGQAEPDMRFWGTGLTPDTVKIAMLTRLDYTKCARRLLHYLEPLHDLDVRIAIVGQGSRRWEVEPELGDFRVGSKVRFAGPIASRAVPPFLAAADIGLHITETDREALSITILEMLAAGLPVVAQPRGCLPDLVAHEINGFLFETEVEIAAALRRLVQSASLRAQMGAASRKQSDGYAMARFDRTWRAFVARCVGESHLRRDADPPVAPEVTIPETAAGALLEQLRRTSVDAPTYFIATSARTGGTLLCTALSATGVAGYPREDLARWLYELRGKSWRYANLDAYLLEQWLLGASARRVYGLRLMLDHFAGLCRTHGTADWPAGWLQRIGQPAWIFLRRRDRLGQAISLYRAHSTGLWWDVGDPKIGVQSVDYDRQAIERCYVQLEHSDRAWASFFERFALDPLELYYEDLVEDLRGKVSTVLEHIGVATPDPLRCQSALQRQADEQTQAWRERYDRGE